MKKHAWASLALLSLLFFPAGFYAAPPSATIEPALQQRLANGTPDELIPVLILLRQRVEWDTLLPQLASLDRRARHERVVRTLQLTAARSQGPLLEFLQLQAAQGQVRRVTPFWAANAVTAEATPAVLSLLSRRPDVLYLQLDHLDPLDPAVSAPTASPAPASPEPGLLVIGADAMWARGWTGQGVLVATIDTGASLSHPALQSRWRGNEPGVAPEEAWFDYFAASSTPSDTVQCQSHGTHVMGTILGDDGLGNQVGVAPGAHWIAARVFGPPGSSCSSSDASKLAGWQWVLDPDGDPGTVDDFPDVVNRSGGERAPGGGGYCRPLPDPTWDAISAVAAAGAAIFFGAGNEGPDPESIISWASQAHSPILAFAVGNVDGASGVIHNSSSRGPSPCDHSTIKPEVVAPGVNIRSSVLGGYGNKTGTSMSTPHVSGAAALLRQAFPHASGEQVQYALLQGTIDLGSAGEDNDYGMGLVNLPAAYHWLFGLQPSAVTVAPVVVAPGVPLTYTVALISSGLISSNAALSDSLPAEARLITGSLWASSGSYGYGDGQVHWNGAVHPGQPVTVTFAVTLSDFVSHGQLLTNVVLLDDGLAWITRSAVVLVDAVPPTSRATSPLYARSTLTVTFAASDTLSGVAETRLWVRYEGGPWSYSGLAQAGESGSFLLIPTLGDGHYFFATQARDWAGGQEELPQGDGDSTTLRDTQSPSSTVLSPESSPVPTFTVSWAGEDSPPASGIAAYLLDVRPDGGDWSPWITATGASSRSYVGVPGERYCFRSIAHDHAGNVQLDLEESCTRVEVEPYRMFLPVIMRAGHEGGCPWTPTLQKQLQPTVPIAPPCATW